MATNTRWSHKRKTFVFGDGVEFPLSTYLAARQVVYIKGFTKNDVRGDLPHLITELKKLVGKDIKDIVVVTDGDQYQDEDFTAFVRDFVAQMLEEGQNVDMLCEPSNRGQPGDELPLVDGIGHFFRLESLGESNATELQKYAESFGVDFECVNGKFTHLRDEANEPLPDWAFYKIKGMIMSHYLSNTKSHTPVIVYCLGGGAAPLHELEYLFIPGRSHLSASFADKLKMTEENRHLFKWYLSTAPSTFSREVKDKTEVNMFVQNSGQALYDVIPHLRIEWAGPKPSEDVLRVV
jgi:hypothetical protein